MSDTIDTINGIIDSIERVIIGKREVIRQVTLALISGGHVLIEDVPGVGKTSLVSSLAKSLDCTFRRIQFTPDILPSDVTGFSIFNRKTGDFEYREGAIMSQFVLADEINRASPKTQSSLLEVMQERQVTVDGCTYRVPSPFMVIATQNPIDCLGTYQLPEAQLDRFFMKISIGYPDMANEKQILQLYKTDSPLDSLTPVASADDVLRLQRQVTEVYANDMVGEYIVQLMTQTRNHPDIELGGSPRASMSLFRAAQASALLAGRDFVSPDDVQGVLLPVVAHRLILRRGSKMQGATAESILQEIVRSVPVPGASRDGK